MRARTLLVLLIAHAVIAAAPIVRSALRTGLLQREWRRAVRAMPARVFRARSGTDGMYRLRRRYLRRRHRLGCVHRLRSGQLRGDPRAGGLRCL